MQWAHFRFFAKKSWPCRTKKTIIRSFLARWPRYQSSGSCIFSHLTKTYAIVSSYGTILHDPCTCNKICCWCSLLMCQTTRVNVCCSKLIWSTSSWSFSPTWSSFCNRVLLIPRTPSASPTEMPLPSAIAGSCTVRPLSVSAIFYVRTILK